jgi:hypothetical protein
LGAGFVGVAVEVVGAAAVGVGFGASAVFDGAAPTLSFTFSLAGGGYVVQKCRPHFGHTQN